MKTLRLLSAILGLMVMITNSSAQSETRSTGQQQNAVIKVLGNCDMCKNRIEKAAKTEGVTSADWDANTRLLTVIFDPVKTNTDSIGKKVAAAGHDTDKYKAPDDVYSKLPACCHYERVK